MCVVSIAIPPLRERGSDIVLLARMLLSRFGHELKKPIKGFTPQAVEALRFHNWPGNVRELENRVKRAVVMAETAYVTAEHLELQEMPPVDGSTLKASRDHREKELVRLAMEKAAGNVTRAASSLGVSRPTLYQLLSRYGLKKAKPDDLKAKT